MDRMPEAPADGSLIPDFLTLDTLRMSSPLYVQQTQSANQFQIGDIVHWIPPQLTGQTPLATKHKLTPIRVLATIRQILGRHTYVIKLIEQAWPRT